MRGLRMVVASYSDKDAVYLGCFGDAEVYRVYDHDGGGGFRLAEVRENLFRGGARIRG
jgi:hypothetical protein